MRNRNALSELKIWNFGRSRSRIVLVEPTKGKAGRPIQIGRSRFIALGQHAADEMKRIVDENSWNRLNDLVEGGFSSSIWREMRHHWELNEVRPISGMHAFGRGNSRVIIVGSSSSAALSPSRIGSTSFIALNESADAALAEIVKSLPGRTERATKAFPVPISGSAISQLRKFYK